MPKTQRFFRDGRMWNYTPGESLISDPDPSKKPMARVLSSRKSKTIASPSLGISNTKRQGVTKSLMNSKSGY